VSRGSALIETVMVGFAVVLLAVQSITAVGRVSAAGATAAEAARYAAQRAARTGSLDAARLEALTLAPDSTVEVRRGLDAVVVSVSIEVAVIGPEGSPISMTVTGRAAATVGRHRSGA